MTDSPRYYTWKGLNCAYTVHGSSNSLERTSAIVTIHPIGVGLSKVFWQPFIHTWENYLSDGSY